MKKKSRTIALVLTLFFLIVMIILVDPNTARAAYPGGNGKIAFVSGRDGNNEIYVMNADGTDQTRLTDNPAYDSGPSWSPDGTKIAFDTDRDGNREVYVMNADGTNLINITNHPASDHHPDWSPDGTKILFASNDAGNGDIFVMNFNQRNMIQYDAFYCDGTVNDIEKFCDSVPRIPYIVCV